MVLACVLAASLPACEQERPPSPSPPPTFEDPDEATAPGPVHYTAPGELEDWISLMERELARLPDDRDAARRHALELYSNRFQLIRARYGQRGTESPPPEVATAVERAEDSFEDLLRRLGREAAVEPAGLDRSVQEVRERLRAIPPLVAGVPPPPAERP